MSDKRKPKHGADGRFIKGGGGGPGRPPTPDLDSMDLPDPPARLAAIGLRDVWRVLAAKAAEGDARAASKLVDLAERFGGDDPCASSSGRYSGVPADVGELLAQLDLSLADVLHRHALGFPLEDVELLAVEAMLPVASPATLARLPTRSRWAGHKIPEIQELRANQNQGVGV